MFSVAKTLIAGESIESRVARAADTSAEEIRIVFGYEFVIAMTAPWIVFGGVIKEYMEIYCVLFIINL